MKLDRKTYYYCLLSCLFCSVIVASNLIFQKFISVNFFNIYTFELSAGVLFYPLTFIISDLITEIYGKKLASKTIRFSIICSFAVMLLIMIADIAPATKWSKVNDRQFSNVFEVYGYAAISSLIASYFAQKTDIVIFSYIRQLTGEKMLWLRSNLSTMIAQLIDTALVLSLLCMGGIIPASDLMIIAISSVIFKFISAIFSTPLFYVACRYLSAKIG